MREESRSTPLPDDVKAAIREMKQQLGQQIGDVDALFRQVCDNINAAIAEAKADEKRTGSAWPVVPMQDIAAAKVSDETRALIKRRGCVVIKQHFAREQALAWDKSMLDYLDHNRFDEHYRGPGDDFLDRWPPLVLKSIRFTGHRRKCRRGRARQWLTRNLF